MEKAEDPGRITSERRMDDKVEIETRYFITRLPNDAQAILETKHNRRRIDYCLHWVLDTAFREADSRVRKDHTLQDFAILRYMALNRLKNEKHSRGGLVESNPLLVGMKFTN